MEHRKIIYKDISWFIFWMAIIFIVLFSSCDPCQRLAKKCPPQARDSIIYREQVVYKDTTIYIRLPQDTVFMGPPELRISIVNGEIVMEKVCKSYGIITACAWIEKSQPYVYAYLNDTSYKVTLRNAIKEARYWEEKYHNEKTTVQVRYIPVFYKFTFWFFIAVVVVVTGYIVVKLKLI